MQWRQHINDIPLFQNLLRLSIKLKVYMSATSRCLWGLFPATRTAQWLELQDVWEKLVGARVLREALGRKMSHCKAAVVGHLLHRELFVLSMHQVWDAPEGWQQRQCC